VTKFASSWVRKYQLFMHVGFTIWTRPHALQIWNIQTRPKQPLIGLDLNSLVLVMYPYIRIRYLLDLAGLLC